MTAHDAHEGLPPGARGVSAKEAGSEINLINPYRENFANYIAVNSQRWPKAGARAVTPEDGDGRTAYIAGAGPSLRSPKALRVLERAREAIRKDRAHVFGCNRAVNWLSQWNPELVTHGITVDQSPAMYTDAWLEPAPVSYLLATSVDPLLVAHLAKHGVPLERMAFFHNFLGIPNEYDLYREFWPRMPVVGNGLNMVNRAAELAAWMGYKRIVIIGADCALAKDGTWHVTGAKNTAKQSLKAKIGGKEWVTYPDMAYSARALIELKLRWERDPNMPPLELAVAPLPEAIMRDKRYKRDPQKFLSRLPGFK